MPVHYALDGHIATITLDRPEALNAIDREMNARLAETWGRFDADDEAWVGILTGAGDRAFCAGADLIDLIPDATARARAGGLTEFNFGGNTRDFQTWKPCIAAINGFALAGGLEIALACDLRIAVPRARFGLPEVRWAIIPGGGGTQRLPRLIPAAKAMELILTGKQIDAEEALQIGLINEMVEPERLMPAAREMAEALLQNGPLALRAAKQAVLQGLDSTLDEGLKLELGLFGKLLLTEDADEGPKAFAEKRAPQYRAR
ncbi:MAG: enoyl-CoA hydratase/isomerase family protein [Dehalococcoidia bacterium]